ncbi:MAG: NADAR family protein [Gemmataceae bacterium]|nr:NADAR family protein [Gemmataceae bacterium]
MSDDARPVIHFYSTAGEYGAFSNFSRHPVYLKKKRWPTTEHYFQAQKFAGEPDEEQVRMAAKPMLAASMGRDRKRPLRRDWEAVKERVMLDALRAKFTQHEELRDLLLRTGDAVLVEHTANDSYWGDGGDGSGKNRLGHLLMQVRDELRAAGPGERGA